MSRTRLTTAGLLGLGAVLLTAGPASAHVFAEETEVAAGAFSQVTITVPHGCEGGSPTTSLEIQIPEDVVGVTPAVHPGWDISVETEALATPIEGEEGTITERTSVVTYTAQAGSELPDGFRDSFVIGYQAPDTPGAYLFFKTIQTCAEGETAWIEEYTGEGEEPATPAPAVQVVEAADAGQAHTDESTTATTAAAGDDGGDSNESEDSDSANAIAIAGLVAGLLGLVTGGIALARTRTRTSTGTGTGNDQAS